MRGWPGNRGAWSGLAALLVAAAGCGSSGGGTRVPVGDGGAVFDFAAPSDFAGAGPLDFSGGPRDLAGPPPDLATRPPDLAQAPTCNDGRRNGTETDVDCGGFNCPPCANGRACVSNTDCLTGSCRNNVCAALPSCNDNVQNQDESDVDCGGNLCPKCALNKKCIFGSDCQSNLCSGGVCKAANKMRVGSFNPYLDGPYWGGDPVVMSCVETCAMLFGGAANQYSCSTQLNVVDNKAFVDGYADPQFCSVPAAENFKKGVTYDCGVGGCSYSAWVSDNPDCDVDNYCWK